MCKKMDLGKLIRAAESNRSFTRGINDSAWQSLWIWISALTREMRECVNLFPHGCGGVFSFSALGEEKMMMPCNHFKIIPFAHTNVSSSIQLKTCSFLDLFSPLSLGLGLFWGEVTPRHETKTPEREEERNKKNTKIN